MFDLRAYFCWDISVRLNILLFRVIMIIPILRVFVFITRDDECKGLEKVVALEGIGEESRGQDYLGYITTHETASPSCPSSLSCSTAASALEKWC